jgi:hypothetical protein
MLEIHPNSRKAISVADEPVVPIIRAHIEADRKAPDSDIQYIQDIRKARFARELECAMRVDELLAAIGDVDYFST